MFVGPQASGFRRAYIPGDPERHPAETHVIPANCKSLNTEVGPLEDGVLPH